MKKIILWMLIIFLAGVNVTGCAVYHGASTHASPVGKTQSDLGQVAYIQKGNLWVKNMPDGTAKQLTTDGTASCPRWSVSGKWLLFQKKNQLWIISSDGTNSRKVTDNINGFTWSSTGDVFYYGTEKDGLVSVIPETRESVVLVKPSPGEIYGRLVNSPDGRYIAFERFYDRTATTQVPEGIWKLDTTNRQMKPVFKGQPPHQTSMGTMGHLAGWSADGETIYMWVGPHSASLTADGVAFTAVDAETGKNLLGNNPPGSLVHKNWFTPSPDPNIAALITAEGGRETWVSKHLSVINLQTKKTKIISRQDQAVASLAFSPAGDRVAYSAGPEEKNMYSGDTTDTADKSRKVMMQRHIWVTRVEDGSLKQLTSDQNYRDEYPLWIAGGDYILFARVDKQDKASLWMMGADGSNPVEVVSELSPFDWFGFYGYMEWDQWFDFRSSDKTVLQENIPAEES